LQVLTTKQESEPPKSLIASDLSETEADVRPNFLIDCNASLIRQLASAAIGARRLSERELAIELTQTVNRTVAIPEQQSAFQRGTAAEFGLIPASTVAQRAVGDATGRSILLAALLRAKQIPARIAFGLRMERSDDDRDRQERQERLVYHAWTIAAVNGQWLPLDPEDGGIASPNRLTLTTTNLASDQEVKAFVPLLEKVGRLRVKIVGQR